MKELLHAIPETNNVFWIRGHHNVYMMQSGGGSVEVSIRGRALLPRPHDGGRDEVI